MPRWRSSTGIRTGGVALRALLDHLGKRDVQGLLVEGGATLAWSFVRDDLVDRVVTYLAPKMLGGATSPRRSSAARGSRPSRAAAPPHVRAGRPRRPRSEGGGAMFTGIVEERGEVRSV